MPSPGSLITFCTISILPFVPSVSAWAQKFELKNHIEVMGALIAMFINHSTIGCDISVLGIGVPEND